MLWGNGNPSFFNIFDFLSKMFWIYHHPIAKNTDNMRMKNPGRK
jgi:hypothetical protein